MKLIFPVLNPFQIILRNFVFLCFITLSFSIYIPPGPRYTCPSDSDRARLLYPCVCEKGTDDGLYVKCENAALATVSVGIGNLASLGMPVERLHLYQCKIGSLYGPLLYRSSVRILIIEDTPLQNIDHYAFMGVNRTLQELHLINTKLEKFPKEAFKILGNLTTLKIDRHKIDSLEKDIFTGSQALGHLLRLHITNGAIPSFPVEAFQNLRKLKTLDLHGNRLGVLQKNQFKGLREVEVLDVSYNNITKLEGQHIADMTKLGWCNASHNSISEIPRGMFARNAVLKWLSLSHNNLKKLDVNSFRGMRFLRRLYLSDNQISEVGRGTFSAITRVSTIDLARNNLTKVDYQMFYQLNFAEIIDVSENQITLVEKQAFKDVYLARINMSHNQIKRLEPDSFINCANITVLDLSHNNISRIGRKVFDETTYATELQLSYNNLTLLNHVPLHNMTGIKILNVSHNAIESIPKGTFPKLYELHTIDVSHNNLSSIATSVFQTLFSIRYLNLSYNSLEEIKSASFGNLPTVLHVDLSHNRLKDISRASLAKLSGCRTLDVSHNHLKQIFQLPISLGELDFSHNNLSSIPDNIWPSMNSLLQLNLSNNNLADNLRGDSLSSLLTVRVLDLNSNGITTPPGEALAKLSSLQYLYLKDNAITKLDKSAFGHLPVVFELDLTNNRITNVSRNAFNGLLQLLTLSLRNNSISYIPTEAFKGLVSLRSLDLSQNNLDKMDNKTNSVLEDCLSLERVNLSHNRISFITKKFFPSNPYIPYKLSNVDLSYNSMPVLARDLVSGTKKMQVLNVSHNILNDIREGVIGNLTSLRVLDLSYNELDDITKNKGVFKLPPNITSINLSHNALSQLPVAHIINATKLTKLDVRYNKIEEIDDGIITRIMNHKLEVYYHGNPFQCDCFARPLKHYLNHLPPFQLEKEELYSSLECAEPGPLKGKNFSSVDDDRLNCIESVASRTRLEDKIANGTGSNYRFDIEADLVFRDVQFSQESILLEWYVISSSDVADFRTIIRDDRNHLYYTKDLPYTARSLQINVNDEQPLKDALFKTDPEQLELCVLAENSATKAVNWFGSQCKKMPSEFKMLQRKLKPSRRTISDVYVERKFTRSTSSCLQGSMAAVYLTFYILYMLN